MSEATGFETVDRKVAKNSFTPLQAWDDIRKVFELLRADENGALLVKGLADVTIGEISVDNVELIDSTGKKLLFTASGEIKAYASDGSLVTLGTTTDADTANTVIGILKALKAKDFATESTLATLATEVTLEAARALLETISGLDFAEETTLSGISGNVGTTSDTDANTTVIGRLQKLIADLSALSATKTLADLETAIEGVTDSIVSMQYGGLPVSEMRTDVVSTSSTPAEAKGGATAWSGQRIVHILNQGSVNIEVLTDDEATYGQIVFPGNVYQDVVDGVIYVMSASAGSARVTEKRYVSS